MNKEDLLKLAKSIKDGTATKEEKVYFLQALNFELGKISKVLSDAQKNKK